YDRLHARSGVPVRRAGRRRRGEPRHGRGGAAGGGGGGCRARLFAGDVADVVPRGFGRFSGVVGGERCCARACAGVVGGVVVGGGGKRVRRGADESVVFVRARSIVGALRQGAPVLADGGARGVRRGRAPAFRREFAGR